MGKVMQIIVRIIVAFVVMFLGVTFAFGSLAAIHFQRIGFGTRGGNWYLASLWLGLCVSVVLPILILYFIFPDIKKKWRVLLALAAALFSFSILGTSF